MQKRLAGLCFVVLNIPILPPPPPPQVHNVEAEKKKGGPAAAVQKPIDVVAAYNSGVGMGSLMSQMGPLVPSLYLPLFISTYRFEATGPVQTREVESFRSSRSRPLASRTWRHARMSPPFSRLRGGRTGRVVFSLIDRGWRGDEMCLLKLG